MISSRAVALAVLAVAGIARACYAVPVEAQDASPEETLAALCVHEAGWDSAADCPAIYAVLSNNARSHHTTWLRALRWHSPRFMAGTTSHPWAHWLRDSDEPPRLLHASWTRRRAPPDVVQSSGRPVAALPSRRERFGALVAYARSFIAEPPVCVATAWGNEADYASGRFAAEHARDERVYCGDTRNIFSRSRRGWE